MHVFRLEVTPTRWFLPFVTVVSTVSVQRIPMFYIICECGA